jgi:hypothetical protein
MSSPPNDLITLEMEPMLRRIGADWVDRKHREGLSRIEILELAPICFEDALRQDALAARRINVLKRREPGLLVGMAYTLAGYGASVRVRELLR